MCLRSISRVVVILTLLTGVDSLCAAEGIGPLVVHEWGTFTALQNEQGEQLMGINVDTEPVPGFVHNLARYLLNKEVLSSDHWVYRQKAVPKHHPLVRLRLETPVIYFYPPAGMPLPHTVDVNVKFRGGWLTEFYPRADVTFPVVHNGEFNFKDLSQNRIGHIAWNRLQIGTDEPGPETDQHVWLAPRNVAAASLTSEKGEHEKYLFYRGVAQQTAPLRVRTLNQGESIQLCGTFAWFLSSNQKTTIQNLWLMETRPDGACAYRRLDPVSVVNDSKPPLTVVAPRRFAEAEFAATNKSRLEEEMKQALLQEGLFADEAQALLSTWQQAYFISPGLRVFYTVPREWTDYMLPLSISGETQITRVMIGRVELISDMQRQLLNKLATSKISKGDWLAKVPPANFTELNLLLAGRSNFGDLGVEIPEDFQTYLSLGRFRNALVAAEQSRTESANLATFIKENRLDPFRLSQGSGK